MCFSPRIAKYCIIDVIQENAVSTRFNLLNSNVQLECTRGDTTCIFHIKTEIEQIIELTWKRSIVTVEYLCC